MVQKTKSWPKISNLIWNKQIINRYYLGLYRDSNPWPSTKGCSFLGEFSRNISKCVLGWTFMFIQTKKNFKDFA